MVRFSLPSDSGGVIYEWPAPFKPADSSDVALALVGAKVAFFNCKLLAELNCEIEWRHAYASR